MQAVVGFHADAEHTLFTTPFLEEHVEVAEGFRSQLNTPRECGSALYVLGMGNQFNKCAADMPLRKATFAAWAVLRGDVTAAPTQTFLTTTLHQRPLVPIAALRELSVPEPAVLAVMAQTLCTAPRQETKAGLGHAARRRGMFGAGAAALHDEVPDAPFTDVWTGATRAASKPVPPTLTRKREEREPIAQIGTVCIDSTKVNVPVSRLLSMLDTYFASRGGDVTSVQLCEVLDVWLAFVYRMWYARDRVDGLVPSKFWSDELQKEYERTEHGGVLLWNWLLEHSGTALRSDMLMSLFNLFQPSYGRGVAHAMMHAHLLVVCGLFAALAHAHGAGGLQPFCHVLTDTMELPPVPAWFEGLTVLTPACLHMWRAHDLIWAASVGLLSERRLVAEVQAQLPGLLLARGACAFSDRRVASSEYYKDVLLVDETVFADN